MIKAVQMSDVHLGFQYNRLPEKSAKIRRQELMQTFRKGLQFAQTQQVDFLLMPGDIFDNPKPERSLVQDVRDALADIAPIRVMIAAGNHDYAYPGSVWLEKEKWPDNVYIFPPYWTHIDFPELHTQVWGASFDAPYQYDTLLQPVNGKSGELQIGVLHGDAYTPDDSVYNPLPQTAIAGSNLNWLAVGHIHKHYKGIAGGISYAYSGVPESHGFDELGEKGALLLTFADGRPTEAFHRLCQRRYEKVNIDISNVASNQEVMTKITNVLKQRVGDGYYHDLFELILTGSLTPDAPIKVSDVTALLHTFYAKIQDDTHLVVDYAALAKEDTLIGNFTQKMLHAINTADDLEKPQLELALQYGIEAFKGGITNAN